MITDMPEKVLPKFSRQVIEIRMWTFILTNSTRIRTNRKILKESAKSGE